MEQRAALARLRIQARANEKMTSRKRHIYTHTHRHLGRVELHSIQEIFAFHCYSDDLFSLSLSLYRSVEGMLTRRGKVDETSIEISCGRMDGQMDVWMVNVVW